MYQVCAVEPRASMDSLPVQSNRCSRRRIYIAPKRCGNKKNNTGQGFNKVPPVCQVCVVEPRVSVDSLPVQPNRCRWSESYFWNAWGGWGKGGHPPVCGIREYAKVFVFPSSSSDKYLGGRIIHSTQDIYCPKRRGNKKKITRDKDLIKCRQCTRCVLLSHGHQWTPFLSSPIDAGGVRVISGTLGGGGHPPVCGIQECAKIIVFSSLSPDKNLVDE
ncbi:hypothetical protein CEXT_772751 [Caerostris extrusa]|uniref:Uncharacterized protein n=1 Tax=Caerostris extrusa TaxID=172846 RepID=A0AAV4UEP1_CAEEX|nr:hypothetical protein CEXT_772751 [Caerostris extrusa]